MVYSGYEQGQLKKPDTKARNDPRIHAELIVDEDDKTCNMQGLGKGSCSVRLHIHAEARK